MAAVFAGALFYSQWPQQASGVTPPATITELKSQHAQPSEKDPPTSSNQISPDHVTSVNDRPSTDHVPAVPPSKGNWDTSTEFSGHTLAVQPRPKQPSIDIGPNPLQQPAPTMPRSDTDASSHSTSSAANTSDSESAFDGQAAQQAAPIREAPYVADAYSRLPSLSVVHATSLPDTMYQPTPSQSQQTVVKIPVGTRLKVRLTDTLSSDRNRTGDTFRAVLDSPLAVDGVVIATPASVVLGRIANARKAPLLGGKADLTLTLTEITTSDGNLVPVATNNIEREGARTGIVNTAKMATGAAFGAVIGAVSGAAEGAGISSGLKNDDATNGFMATTKTVVLPAGTQVSFDISSPLAVSAQASR